MPDSRNATPQSRMPFERALQEEARQRGHLLHGMRERVTEREAVEAIRTDRRASQPQAFMDREDPAGLLEHLVELVEGAVAEVAAVQVVRTHHHADESEARATRRASRAARAGSINGTIPTPARRVEILVAVRRDPVVVRRTRPGGRVDVVVRLERHEQPHRRVEDGRVDPLLVHRPQVRRGVEAVLELVRKELEVAAGDARGGLGQVHGLQRVRAEHVGRLDHMGVGVEYPQISVHPSLSVGTQPRGFPAGTASGPCCATRGSRVRCSGPVRRPPVFIFALVCALALALAVLLRREPARGHRGARRELGAVDRSCHHRTGRDGVRRVQRLRVHTGERARPDRRGDPASASTCRTASPTR